ncbi:MAG: GNAT family N-acetyltransferase [Defluviitaleaceae bacterium]|nr:GNAT family N-acetyltransferase [Defluviitaleaceae bacterium]
MDIKFNKLSNFNQGILYQLLADAYSFDGKYEATYKEKWLADENFFFDNLTNIGDKYCFVTTLGDEAIGFLAWDPRNLPEYAIIGDNCIIPKYKGKGYGKLQLQEAISRITKNDVKEIFVSTDNDFIPAQRMYESVGFTRLEISTLKPWQVEQNSDIYYGMEICTT